MAFNKDIFELANYQILTKTDSQLKEFLIGFFSCGVVEETKYLEVLQKGRCVRVIENGDTKSVSWNYYSTIEWDIYGLSYKPEHGQHISIINNAQVAMLADFINK